MSSYKIEAGTGQHIGDRSEQQDRIGLFTAPRAPGYMMAVLADGMGGASGGSIAAEQAIRTAQQVFEHFSPLIEDVETMLQEIVNEIHTVIQLMTLATEMRPHTTLAILVITADGKAIWGHVGDSRVYRFSGPNLAERTVDHSYFEQMIGQPGSVPGASAPPRTILANVIGNPLEAPVLTLGRCADLKAGDAFMLCSDGLWHHCNDEEFGAAIAMNSPRDAAQMLITKARKRATGGDADNCTLGVIKLIVPPKPVSNFKVDTMRRAV
jgi:serine/threonine protein phosphatase PrpC